MSTLATTTHPPFDMLVGQPQVARFLSTAVAEERVSHAYLFVGPIGSGKTDAAFALSKALICDKGGCGACDACVRIARRTHPDVHVVDPEGVSGYVADQIRDVIHDTTLAPIRAKRKLYIFTRADLLRGAPANAFLKTLEEPPSSVTFVLLARTRDSVMDTILSRCQVIAFRHIPASEAENILCRMAGSSPEDARIALGAAGGSTRKAYEFLRSPLRRECRLKMIDVLEHLPQADDLDVLAAAKELIVAIKAPLDDVRIAQENEREEGSDYLTKGALSALEKRHKRELSQRERESMHELFFVARSWLRDCLTCTFGAPELLVNVDCPYTILQLAPTLDGGALMVAIASVDKATERISYNVSPQLAIEVMLFDIREVFYANGSGG